METIGNLAKTILSKQSEVVDPNSIMCNKCNTYHTWTDKQWRINCKRCGTVLVRVSRLPQPEIKCWICVDTGISTYKAQFDDISGEFGAACICQAGDKFANDIVPRVNKALFAPPVESIIRDNKIIAKEAGNA